MTIICETKNLAIEQIVELHRTVAKRFSVEILEGVGQIRLQRVRFGALGEAFQDGDFAFIRLGESIPTGAIRATPNSSEPVQIRYRVKSGSDFTGVPEGLSADCP